MPQTTGLGARSNLTKIVMFTIPTLYFQMSFEEAEFVETKKGVKGRLCAHQQAQAVVITLPSSAAKAFPASPDKWWCSC